MADTYAFTIVGGYVGIKKNSEGQSSYPGRFFRFKVFAGGFRVSSHLEKSQNIDYSILTADTVTLDGVAVTGTDQQRADALKAVFPEATSSGGGVSSNDLNTAIATREPVISSGTTAQYIRGDKSLATFPTIPTNNNQLTNGAGYAPSASPAFTGTPTGITKAHVGLSNVDNTSDSTKNSAAVTLTNKTISGTSNTLTSINRASVLLPTDSIIEYFGDSHWAYGYDSGNPYFNSWGTSTWFNILTGGKFYQPAGGNLGVAGNTTTQMVARLGAALAYRPALVLVDGGGNDITAGATTAAIQANLLTVVNAFKSIGSRIVIMTIFPRYSPNAFTAPQEVIRLAVNAYILTLADSSVSVIDIETYMSSGIFQSDGVHLTSVGANTIGGLFATVVSSMVDPANISNYLNADNSLTTNVVLAGTSGGLNTATGSVATSWTGLGNSAGGGTVVFSKTATGGTNQQVITLSGTYTGTNRYAGLLSNFATTAISAGDVTESILDYEVTSALTNVSGMSISTTYNGAGGYISDSYSYYPIDGLAQSIPVGRYQLRGVPFVAPVGVTSIDCNVIIFFANGTSLPLAGVVKIWKAGVRKAVPQLATTSQITTGDLVQRKTRRAIANVAATLNANDHLIAYTSLTATRALTLGAASLYPDQHFVLKDEAGTAGTNALTIVGTVNGASNPTAVNSNYGAYKFYSNGTAWFSE